MEDLEEEMKDIFNNNEKIKGMEDVQIGTKSTGMNQFMNKY